MLRRAAVLALTAAAALPASAHAAKQCDEPGSAWQRATPAEAGMDAGKLRAALQYGTSQAAFAIRVYRNGCLVAEDAFAPPNRTAQYESWSMAKSITSLVFGRAMTLGLISPDDPVGSLLPEADAAHGKVTVRDLLTMTGGFRWNGLRDYDIAMPDRIRDALTVDFAHEPGTFWEYSQSGPALLAMAVQRAVGQDFQAFAQRELLGPLGIAPGRWSWTRDSKGATQGFFGVQMVPDDYARLGELLRREGLWEGRRLLAKRYVREALTPTPTNGCYGWLIWLNEGRPCIGPRVANRPFRQQRPFPTLPSDLFRYSGLFGQLVAVFPSQGIVVQRNGQDPGTLNFTGGQSWETRLYEGVLGALSDGTPVERPGEDAPAVDAAAPGVNPDDGFQTSITEPDQALAPFVLPALPPAGPQRARALRLRLAHPKVSRKRVVTLRATCPSAQLGRCDATVGLEGVAKEKAVRLQPGQTTLVRFRLAQRPTAARTLVARATVKDGTATGTPARVPVTVQP